MPDPTPEPLVRHAARVLVVDPDDRLLLIRVQLEPPFDGRLWLTPGGGLEPGESHLDGARRELWEETGLRAGDLRPVWDRTYRFVHRGRRREHRERYFFMRTATTDVAFTSLQADEIEQVLALRWWPLSEIRAATAERFVPHRLGWFLPPLLRGDLPAAPISIVE